MNICEFASQIQYAIRNICIGARKFLLKDLVLTRTTKVLFMDHVYKTVSLQYYRSWLARERSESSVKKY